jgi:hypothetical protein
MKIVSVSCCALGICVATALLAACGGSQPPIGAPGTMPQSRATTTYAERGGSWMLPGAKSEDLLYVSDNLANDVDVLSYPQGNAVGMLTGFNAPSGECSDTLGNVWIINLSPPELIEYAHGGTTPINTLSEEGQPFSCSVDAASGNLAVGNLNGNVAIYQSGQGMPAMYTDPDIPEFYYVSYDGFGNLFADGQAKGVIAELPAGSSSLSTVQLSKDVEPGSLQWDGKYLAMVEYSSLSRGPTIVDRIQVSGTNGAIVATSQLIGRKNRKPTLLVQYWVHGRMIIGPEYSLHRYTRVLGFWRYPKGGQPTTQIHPQGASQLWGITISKAPK